MPTQNANAVWNGTLVDGSGQLKTGSGTLDAAYSWKSRSAEGTQTNPEELIAAAHAGCYSMALAHILSGAGTPPQEIRTHADVVFDKVGDGFEITRIKLTARATVPGLAPAEFARHAESAKVGCPVSKALAAVPIELEASLA